MGTVLASTGAARARRRVAHGSSWESIAQVVDEPHRPVSGGDRSVVDFRDRIDATPDRVARRCHTTHLGQSFQPWGLTKYAELEFISLRTEPTSLRVKLVPFGVRPVQFAAKSVPLGVALIASIVELVPLWVKSAPLEAKLTPLEVKLVPLEVKFTPPGVQRVSLPMELDGAANESPDAGRGRTVSHHQAGATKDRRPGSGGAPIPPPQISDEP